MLDPRHMTRAEKEAYLASLPSINAALRFPEADDDDRWRNDSDADREEPYRDHYDVCMDDYGLTERMFH